MRSHVNGALARAERETDTLLAYLRTLVFVALASVLWATGTLSNEHMAMLSIAGLGTLAAASLALTWSGFSRPWLPWAFATLDVALLLHCVSLLALATGMPSAEMLSAPGASLIFLLLATAAVRHRPFLVLYTGSLFIAGWLALWATSGGVWAPPAISGGGLADEVLRLSIVALAAAILFVAVERTRRTLTYSIREAHLRTNLARFFSPGMADELARSAQVATSFKPQKAAVMFVDIRGFTSIAEGLGAPELALFLNEYRHRMTQPVSAHGGIVDKFIGDGIMAVFGVPHPGEHDARNAVRCALDILAATDRWNEERAIAGLAPIRVGIGVHFGDVTAGALGDEQRLEFTVIGDTVNAANRIEELAGDLGERLIVSLPALQAAGQGADPSKWEPLPEQVLRGRRASIGLARWRDGREARVEGAIWAPTARSGREPPCLGANGPWRPVACQDARGAARLGAP